MKILITGSNGFIAKNLIAELRNRGYEELFLCSRATTKGELEQYIEACHVIVHLAGVNRPLDEREYYTGNVGFTEEIIRMLENGNKKVHVIYSSTAEAVRHKSYGDSKRKAEELLQEYAEKTGGTLTVFRLPNVFGKWCRPDYNSFIATFCHNVSRGLPIRIDDPDFQIKLAYIDDVVDEFISCIEETNHLTQEYRKIPEIYETTVGKVADMILSFENEQDPIGIPCIHEPLRKKLYSTYLSYKDPERCRHRLKMNIDERGSFTEFMHLGNLGQISVNVAKPGIVKGNHWHHTKVEKFLVVQGEASIRLRHIITGNITEFLVSGKKLEIIDIPAGYVHNITNIGTEDLVTIMWASEIFDRNKADTYYEKL